MNYKKPAFWDYQSLSFWSILLFPVSIIYFLLISIARIFKSSKKFSIPIICIGNIYIGGTGKTPLAREIFYISKNLQKNPVFIKKKYDYLNDEIEMLKKTGKTIVCDQRKIGIKDSIINNHDLAILDDGFQDFSIKPNFSILCFNSKQLIGNGLMIPAGPLREKFSAILRANCIIINGEKNLKFENKINSLTKKKLHIFYSKYKIINIEKLKNKKITAFAGIGNPTNFFDLLRENNINLVKTYSFPDHHNYSKKDFIEIFGDKSSKIITTEKDYFRMTSDQKKNCDYVSVNLEIENKDKLRDLIKLHI